MRRRHLFGAMVGAIAAPFAGTPKAAPALEAKIIEIPPNGTLIIHGCTFINGRIEDGQYKGLTLSESARPRIR